MTPAKSLPKAVLNQINAYESFLTHDLRNAESHLLESVASGLDREETIVIRFIEHYIDRFDISAEWALPLFMSAKIDVGRKDFKNLLERGIKVAVANVKGIVSLFPSIPSARAESQLELHLEARSCHWLAELERRWTMATPAKDSALSDLQKRLLEPAGPKLTDWRKKLVGDYRKLHNLTMADLSRRAGRSEAAIYGMIHGKKQRFGLLALESFLTVIGVSCERWCTPE